MSFLVVLFLTIPPTRWPLEFIFPPSGYEGLLFTLKRVQIGVLTVAKVLTEDKRLDTFPEDQKPLSQNFAEKILKASQTFIP